MLSGKRIAVIIPALNEEKTLPRVLNDISRELVDEVIVVDNGSSDRTAELAKELGAFAVNVNAVAPGLIETAMLKESEARDKIIDLAMGESALKRVGQPEDLANLVAFLASDKARHITGEVIKIDGGQYI